MNPPLDRDSGPSARMSFSLRRKHFRFLRRWQKAHKQGGVAEALREILDRVEADKAFLREAGL